MDWPAFFDSHAFTYIILPILIFCARIVDVSIDTMRVIFITKGYRWLAPLCGFFEVLIWLLAVTQIMKNLSNAVYYIAYAGGFATGNYVGMIIEQHIALGTVLIRVITKKESQELLDYFKSRKYGVTVVDAEGLFDKVKILLTVIKRTDIPEVVESIKHCHPQAFYTIEDVRFVNENSYTLRNSIGVKKRGWFQSMRNWK